MIIWVTACRSRWPCMRPPMRARFDFIQSCCALISVVDRRFAIIWLMLSLSSATSPSAATVMLRVRSPRVTAVDTDGRLGGQAEVAGVSGTWRHLTENVNQLAGNLTTQV